MYNDKLILWNEGRLPDGFTIETLLDKHPSRPYNKTIAEIFFKAGFIEAWGRGISKIITGFKLAKLPVPDFEAKMGGIVVTVYRKSRENEGLNDKQNTTKKDHVVDHVVENVVDHVVDNRLSKIINLIKNNNQISANKIAKLLGVTSRTAQRDLEKLTKQKRIKRKGSERGGYWEIINE